MIRRLARLSVRARLTLIGALGAALVLITASLLLFVGFSSTLRDALVGHLAERVAVVSADIADGLAPSGLPPGTQVIDRDATVVAPPGDLEPYLTSSELARASEGELVLTRSIAQIGGRARVVAAPAVGPQGDEFVVVAAGSTAPNDEARQRLVFVLGIAGPVLVGAVALAAWLVAGAALAPVTRLTAGARDLSLGDAPDQRLPVPDTDDEIFELATTFNALLDRLALTLERERSFIDDASHELRSPLAVLRGELELAQLQAGPAEVDPGEVHGTLTSALAEADRLGGLMNSLLLLARADAGQLVTEAAPVDVLAVASRVAEQMSRPADVEVTVHGDAGTVPAGEYAVEQIFANVVGNAMAWARSEVWVIVRWDASTAVIEVADDGPGFPPELIRTVFERFTRGDPTRGRHGGGAGLGLAIAAAVVRGLGGEIRAENGPPLGGAVVRIRLPA